MDNFQLNQIAASYGLDWGYTASFLFMHPESKTLMAVNLHEAKTEVLTIILEC